MGARAPFRAASPHDLALCPPYRHVATIGARDGTLHGNHVVFCINTHNFQIPYRDLVGSHAAGHLHTGKDARGKARGTDRTGSAVKHRTVARGATTKMMPLDQAGEPPPFAGSDDIDDIFRLKLFCQNPITLLQVARTLPEMELAQELHAVRT